MHAPQWSFLWCKCAQCVSSLARLEEMWVRVRFLPSIPWITKVVVPAWVELAISLGAFDFGASDLEVYMRRMFTNCVHGGFNGSFSNKFQSVAGLC